MMTLKIKILLSVLIILGIGFAYTYLVLETQTCNIDEPLEAKTGINLFDYPDTYISYSSNAIATKNSISTGMYTDANYENYCVTFEVLPKDSYLEQAWSKGQAYIVFESRLQSTIEWIVDNKYKITMYYYEDDKNMIGEIVFFQKEWAGNDHIISYEQPLPKESQNKSIYIKYESILGSFLFLTNGNDVRFFDNYLSVR